MTALQATTSSLELIERLNHRFISPGNLWGEFGSRGRGIIFTESGLARTGQIMGFIAGISHYDKEAATRLADDFVEQMDYLSNYGGTEVIQDHLGDDITIPCTLVELADDGTFGGFSVLWFRYSEKPSASGDGHIRTGGHCKDQLYSFSMNGGLLATGLFANSHESPILAATIGSTRVWSLHT